MRFLVLCVLILSVFLGSVKASDVNINFADLFQGLDLAAPGASGEACNATELATLEGHHAALERAEQITHDIDVYLYAADGYTLNQPDVVQWDKIYNILVEGPADWSGSVTRASNMFSDVISPGEDGYKQWWAAYVWPYQFYDLVDWQLLSRAMSYDEESALYRVITTAWASFQKKGTTNVYKVLETYNSFYRTTPEGKVIQTKFHFTQDGYDFAKSYSA